MPHLWHKDVQDREGITADTSQERGDEYYFYCVDCQQAFDRDTEKCLALVDIKRGNNVPRMVVAAHGSDTCAAVVPEVAKAGFQQIDKATKNLGITVQGMWTNRSPHTIYSLVEALNAHVIGQLSRDIYLVDWNTVVVNPVVTLQEAMDSLQ